MTDSEHPRDGRLLDPIGSYDPAQPPAQAKLPARLKHWVAAVKEHTTNASSAVSPSGETAPKISVCLLVYNHAHLLERTALSILDQAFRDYELLICDDCSSDDSSQVIERLARKDPRVKALRTPQNLGMAANANFCVSHAQGEFIALLHHDDLYDPSLLAKWLAHAQRYPSVGVVSNAYGYFNRSDIDYHPFQACHPGKHALENLLLVQLGCPIRGTAFIRRSAWRDVGGMRERFGLLADVDLWMRIARRWDVGYIPEPLIIVRQDRPADYPQPYVSWSWDRMRILYEIHGANRAEHFDNRPLRRHFEMLRLRSRVNLSELRWLAYAVFKRRWDMLATSGEVENAYELAPVRALRRALETATRRVQPTGYTTGR